MASINEIWEEAKAYIEEELTPVVFHEYVATIHPVSYENDTFILKVDAEYKVSLIEQQYHFLIIKAIRYATGGKNVNVRYVLNEMDVLEAAMATAPLPSIKGLSTALSQEFTFNPKFTFETFVVGSNNRLAHAAALAVADHPGKRYNPLFIYGGVGLGKTHLMQAIAQQSLKTRPSFKVVYVSSEKFTNEFIDAIKRESNIQFRAKYRSVDMLLVDDIQFFSGKEGTQEEFFHTFNDLYNAEKQIILTSDKPPKDIPNLEERLRSRFEWGLGCDVTAPNYETRLAILGRKAEEEGIQVQGDVLEYIALKIDSNIRELEGLLMRVKMIQDVEGRVMGLDELTEHLKEIISENEKHVPIEVIIQSTAMFFKVGYSDILSQKRTSAIAAARQVAMYLARALTDLSLQAVGEFFGGRDYSTVIHAINKIKAMMANDPLLTRDISQLASEIKAKC